ncbi:MAG: transporter substrate-binding domain-containing protein [Pseudomonadota bacterium]
MALVAGLFATPAQAEKQALRVGFYANEPNMFRDRDGARIGFWPDITDAVARRLDLEISYIDCLWTECLRLLEAGKIDVMPDVAFSQDRAERFRFGAHPVLYIWSELLVPPGSTAQRVADIKGLPIAAVEGSVQAQEVLRRADLGLISTSVMQLENEAEVAAAITDGWAGAGLVNNLYATLAMQRSELKTIGRPVQTVTVHYGFRPDMPQKLIDAFDLAVYQMQISAGSPFISARARWIEQRPAAVPEWVWGLVILLLFMAGTAALTAVVFHQRVRRRTLELNKTVTALRRALDEREAAQVTALALQKNEALGRLVGGVAHDFNNLLSVITGNLDVLRLSGLPKEDQEALDDAAEAVLRGSALTRQLLAFGRRAPLNPERVPISDLLHEMVGLLERTLPTSIEIRINIATALSPADLDPGILHSAILNLALNARDAMPSGGKLTIFAAMETLSPDDPRLTELDLAGGRYLQISICDTGTGMSEAVMAHAIEPFFTTKPVGEGSGMGLAMVFGFVRQSGGGMLIESTPGQGTDVHLFFPPSVLPVHRRADAASQGAEGIVLYVLLVEDSVTVRRAIARQLSALGHRVIAVSSGEEALETLSREAVDIVLSDAVMPGPLQGPDLITRIAVMRPGLPVVLMTGYMSEDGQAQPGKAVADGTILLGKPISSATLQDALQRAMHTEGQWSTLSR